jgi:phosphate-selective porin OprO/OprP
MQQSGISLTKTGKLGLMVGVANIAMMSSAMAQATNADMAARIQALEDRLDTSTERALADRTRLSTLEQQYAYASWTFDNGRPVLSTGDGRFTMGIRVRFQSDFAGYMQDDTHPAGFAGPTDLASGAVVRRGFFGVEGKVYNDFAYEFRINAGGSNGGTAGVPNASEGDPLMNKAQVTYTGIPDWHFTVGIIEPVLMAEGTDSSASLMFMERPEIDNIGADSFGAGDARRGMEIGWSRTDAIWAGDNLAITAAFTGGKTGNPAGHGNGGDEQSQVLGRISDRLWTNGLSNIQVGVSAGKVLYSGNTAGGGSQTINFQDRPQARVDGSRLVSTGGIAAKTGDLISFDFEGNLDNFYLGAEWAQFGADRQCGTTAGFTGGACAVANGGTATTVADHPTFSGWFVEGTWIITGETKAYTPSAINNEVGGFANPVPARPFSLAGDSWGAWELAARYSSTDLNWNTNILATNTATRTLAGIAGGKEDIITLGVNCYLNRNVKFTVNDMIVSVKKGTLALPTRDSQDLNIVGVRLQFAN